LTILVETWGITARLEAWDWDAWRKDRKEGLYGKNGRERKGPLQHFISTAQKHHTIALALDKVTAILLMMNQWFGLNSSFQPLNVSAAVSSIAPPKDRMRAPNGTGTSRYLVTFSWALWVRMDWRQREPTEEGEGGTSAASGWLMVAAEIFLRRKCN
jgi:hypothetical protein